MDSKESFHTKEGAGYLCVEKLNETDTFMNFIAKYHYNFSSIPETSILLNFPILYSEYPYHFLTVAEFSLAGRRQLF